MFTCVQKGKLIGMDIAYIKGKMLNNFNEDGIMATKFTCDGCQRVLESGEEVLEIARSRVNYDSEGDGQLWAEETEGILCNACEEVVAGSFWADVQDIQGGLDADGNAIPANRDIAQLQREKDGTS